ncbi:MAG: hypothetical protein ACXWQQ_14690 [Pseudobdellovibrio sp.]
MKSLIVSLLVVLTSTIVFAQEQDEVFPPAPVNAEGAPLNFNLPAPKYRPLTDDEKYEADQRESLRVECQYRRSQDQASHGDGIVDRAIGNRVRDNLEQNRRDAMDGYGSVQRNDGTTYVYRKDRCADINGDYQTDAEREAGKPGFKPKVSVDRHSFSVGGTIRW